MGNNKKSRRSDDERRTTQEAVSLGYILMGAFMLFGGGGYWLDVKRDSGNLYTLIGIGLAFTYSGYEVWKLVRAMSQANTKSAPPPETEHSDKNHDE